MALKFSCTNCGQTIILKFLKIGDHAKCYSCEAEIIVPSNAITTNEEASIVIASENLKKSDQSSDSDESKSAAKSPYDGVKLYSIKSILVATYIGGPLASTFLISRNYKRMGNSNAARKSMNIGILATFLYFTIILLIPTEINEQIPWKFIVMIYTFATYFIVKYLQGKQINKHARLKGKVAYWYDTIGIGLMGLAITLTYIIVISLFDPIMEGDRITVGDLNHEIYYGKNVSESEAAEFGDSFMEIGFLGDEFTQYLKIEKTTEGYIILIPVDKIHWEDEEVLDVFRQIDYYLEGMNDQDNIKIMIFEDGFNGRMTKEIN